MAAQAPAVALNGIGAKLSSSSINNQSGSLRSGRKKYPNSGDFPGPGANMPWTLLAIERTIRRKFAWCANCDSAMVKTRVIAKEAGLGLPHSAFFRPVITPLFTHLRGTGLV